MTRERIEELAAELHEVYMKEATRQGDVRHAEDYNDLPENIKEFDRALARFILSREKLLLEKIGKPLEEGMKAGRKEIEKELMCELRAPNGTIWEHAKWLQDENDALKRDIFKARKEGRDEAINDIDVLFLRKAIWYQGICHDKDIIPLAEGILVEIKKLMKGESDAK